jgi:hypothetical protein
MIGYVSQYIKQENFKRITLPPLILCLGAYRDYCIKNGFKPMSQANFNKDVEAYGDQICRAVDKLGRRRTWRGLRLRE